ncbi:Crp/Fnr family transcriptional regulator [Olleya sp. R77988]|uniref:Crp/Fnr family transcriptional regulator n=1 Tax=Olleya sp. R77988 TaxID=3093875 RepID=UPI0037C974DA
MSKKPIDIKTIFKGLQFSKQETVLVEGLFTKEIYKKGDIILQPDDVVHFEYFIKEGCLRSFYIDKQGKEHTVQFGVKDWWISDYTAYFSTAKSIMHIEVLQDAIVYKLSLKDKKLLYQKAPSTESYSIKKLERAFAAFQKRILSNLSETATERYINFKRTYPNIESQVKNYHIASFLGITTQSLSRIRKKISQTLN